MKSYIREDSCIVIRCVKETDTKRCYETHFDNYKETYVIPLMAPTKSPKGTLMAWFGARRYPRSIIEQMVTKSLYQNRLFRLFMRRFLLKK